MTICENKRFHDGARAYTEYLQTAEGRLRTDLAFANLQEFLPCPSRALHVLDIGCGPGVMAVRLAQGGCHVTLLDSSTAMLEEAKCTAERAGVADKVDLRQGDASRVTEQFPAAAFDLVLCHNLLEFVEDPASVLRACAEMLRGPSAVLSVVVRSQAGEVLKSALKSGDLEAAEANLTADWGWESLYGGKVRLFTPDALFELLRAESLTPVAERGIRVLSDYLPPSAATTDNYQRLVGLEAKLGRRPEFARVARYMHWLARRMETKS